MKKKIPLDSTDYLKIYNGTLKAGVACNNEMQIVLKLSISKQCLVLTK